MELRDYLRVIRTRKWVIILATAVVAATAFFLSSTEEPVYRSEVRVLIAERDAVADLLGGLPSDTTGLETQIQIMQTRPFAEKTVQALGLDIGPEAVLARTEVSVVGTSRIVSMKVTDADSERAAAIANQMADEYVLWSRETRLEDLAEAMAAMGASLERVLQDAEERQLEFARRVEGEVGSEELATLLRIKIGLERPALADKLEVLKLQEQLETGSSRVISPATANANPVSPKPTRSGAFGLVVGLVFGLGLAFLFEHLDVSNGSKAKIQQV